MRVSRHCATLPTIHLFARVAFVKIHAGEGCGLCVCCVCLLRTFKILPPPRLHHLYRRHRVSVAAAAAAAAREPADGITQHFDAPLA